MNGLGTPLAVGHPIRWLASTIGKRGYIARYLRDASPRGSVVIGTGNDPFTPGFMSCDSAFTLPAISDATYPEAVLNVCRREQINAVISLSDLDLPRLAEIREELNSMGISCFFPDHATIMRFLNKSRTATFLESHGFRTPPTFRNLDEAIHEIGFPMVIKPSCGSASVGVGTVRTVDQAKHHWESIEGPIAQPLLEGAWINVEACSDPNGRLLGISAWERHRSVAGETLLSRTISHDRALDLVTRLLNVSPIPGPIDLDMIEMDGDVVILEVNTRFGGGYPTSHLAGADFPGAMVRALTGQHVGEVRRFREGVVMMKQIEPVAYDLRRVHMKDPSHPGS
jgi:carbamoyl-phosphate synthase large subunit